MSNPKNYYVLFFSLSLFLYAQASLPAQLPEAMSFTFIINNAGPQAKAAASNLTMNRTDTQQHQPIDVTVSVAEPVGQQLPYHPSLLMANLGSALRIKHIIGGVVGGTLLGIWATYLWYYSIIYSKTAWSQWHTGISVEELYQLPFEHVRAQFLETLKKRYCTGAAKPHLGSLLFSFEKDLVYEINSLNTYLSFYSLLKKTRLYWLLPSQESMYKTAQDNLKRLDFLQHVANKLTAPFLDA